MNQCCSLFLIPFTLWLIASSSPMEKSQELSPARKGETEWNLPGFVRLGELPRLPEHRTVHQFSSHNRQGLNGDSGWRLYEDEHGDAVICDIMGPGCIRSIWSTDIRKDSVFKFRFDGEPEPRYEIPMLDFFQGKHQLSPPPLVSYERRGYWGDAPFSGNCFVPIPFSQGIKISVSGTLEFYHILYERYPQGSSIETFTGEEDRGYLLEAFEKMGQVPYPLGEVETFRVEKKAIAPGEEFLLMDLKREGCIRQIVLEAEDSQEWMQENLIQMKWDDHLLWDVRAPIGFFFGSAVQAENMSTMPMRTEKLKDGRVRLTSWFPMPFWRRALISLVNRSSRQLGPVKAEISVSPSNFPQVRSGYFTTLFRRGETTYGRDWHFFETPGTGWFVGAVQSMKGEHYCEGDEHFTMDLAVSPQINGTGSEDYFLGCFWPNREYNSPFANCVGDIQEQGGGTFQGSYSVPSCYSRFHLDAPIPFYLHMDARIQHGGMSNITSSYGSLAFCYLQPRPVLHLTDFIEVGNAMSEDAHCYKGTASQLTGPVKAHPEGNYFCAALCEEGRIHSRGEISFLVAIARDNEGVRLRRRLDQGQARQTADVYIDGNRVGWWYHPDHNEHLRWFDSDFDIHPKFTRGKGSLSVKLIVHAEGGRGNFTDFSYWIYSFRFAPGGR